MMVPTIARDPQVLALADRLRRRGGVVSVAGLWGSSAPMVAALACAAAGRRMLYVTSHLEEADEALDDLEFFSRDAAAPTRCELFPAWEANPGEGAAAAEIEAERLRLCTWLMSSSQRSAVSGQLVQARRPHHKLSPNPSLEDGQAGSLSYIVAPIQALMQPVPTRAELEARTFKLALGDKQAPERVLAWLVEHGFERLDLVESPGDCAQRGDIVDVFAPGETMPYRLEFEFERVTSIRRFDAATQRSDEKLASVALTAPASVPLLLSSGADTPDSKLETRNSKLEAALFLDYLPADTLIVLDNPADVQEMGRTYRDRVRDPESMFPVTHVLSRLAEFDQLYLGRFGSPAASTEDGFTFDVRSLSRFEGRAAEAVAELRAACRDHTVIVVCDTEGERQRLREMLLEDEGRAPDPLTLAIGWIHRGFEWVPTDFGFRISDFGLGTDPPRLTTHHSPLTLPTIVVGHHEIFHRLRPRRRIRRVEAATAITAWTDLQPGDYVVHVVHGIARFKELHTIRKGDSGKQEEYLTLEFAEQATIHVPVSQIDLVQKYIGAAGHKPKLSSLGGTRWKKTTEKAQAAVADLAESMLRIQAERQNNPGVAYPADTEWQKEFEAAFPYQETEDQITAACDIKADLCRPMPMDRLLCGDVGYGKTELAMRAAFKVVEYGRQVAVLVPTTVLAEQHFQSFSDRFAEYPFSLACLSRFRTGLEQSRIVDAARKGQVDIVIGTHRLLSKDVGFANLGLVVIDEEQRFGVEHKERLKELRSTVEVLTLTATPIPRTLHMAMLGIRDIGALMTPPMDRRSIATQVRPFSAALIREAVLREMNRDGQVFFVHNYVQSIAAMADRIGQIVPEARIVYGHGQMKEHELERVMTAFVQRQADVLVCTTIIESGIDIPSANTIFINRADRFGLADLHQLRGRVGRSKHRAYCYLLLSPDRPVTSKAAKRLKAIEEFSELGAGFRIAMRDLEIRGAGNILGDEQSGHIAAIGYELYCRLLERAVRSLKNEPDPTPKAVHLELNVSAHIPSNYIAAARSRLEIYRRMVACATAAELRQLEKDLADAFGPHPPAVAALLELTEIRVLARHWGIHSIILEGPDIVFRVEDLVRANPAFVGAPGSVRMADAKTIHLRPRSEAYLEPKTLLAFLRKQLTSEPLPTHVGTRSTAGEKPSASARPPRRGRVEK